MYSIGLKKSVRTVQSRAVRTIRGEIPICLPKLFLSDALTRLFLAIGWSWPVSSWVVGLRKQEFCFWTSTQHRRLQTAGVLSSFSVRFIFLTKTPENQKSCCLTGRVRTVVAKTMLEQEVPKPHASIYFFISTKAKCISLY